MNFPSSATTYSSSPTTSGVGVFGASLAVFQTILVRHVAGAGRVDRDQVLRGRSRSETNTSPCAEDRPGDHRPPRRRVLGPPQLLAALRVVGRDEVARRADDHPPPARLDQLRRAERELHPAFAACGRSSSLACRSLCSSASTNCLSVPSHAEDELVVDEDRRPAVAVHRLVGVLLRLSTTCSPVEVRQAVPMCPKWTYTCSPSVTGVGLAWLFFVCGCAAALPSSTEHLLVPDVLPVLASRQSARSE